LKRLSRELRHLDELNVQLIREIHRVGPRNISEVARVIGASKRTVHARFTKLRGEGLLRVRAVPTYHLLGLIGVHLFADISLRRDIDVINTLAINDYLCEVRYCLGRYRGLLAKFVIPVERIKEFEEYIDIVEDVGLLKNCVVRYVVDFKPFLPNMNYFDFKSRSWHFNPETFLDDLKRYGIGRIVLRDPDYFRLDVDYLDVLIVWALERDATIKLAAIARMANVSRALVKYHYDVHVGNKLIKGYLVEVPFFIQGTYGSFLLEVNFQDSSGLERFAYIISRTPYIRTMCKEYRRDTLFAMLEVPVSDVCSFMFKVINELSEECGVANCQLHMLSTSAVLRRGIPKDLFEEDRGWRYRGDHYISELQRLP